MRYAFLLLFLTVVSSVYMDVPAVRGDYEGEMVRIYVEEVNGTGGVYVSIMPTAGTFFQDSINTVAKLVDIGHRTILIRTNMDEGSIDGPSAGLALYTLFRSLVENEELLHNHTLTSAVDEKGNALPVGGTYEKVYASAKSGKIIGVAPVEEHFDRSLILLSKKWNTTVCFIRNTEEAYAFMTSGECPPLQTVKRDVIQPKYESTYFKDQSYILLKDLPPNHSAWSLYNVGLYYSAGNEAFLDLTYGEIEGGLTVDHREALRKELLECLETADPLRTDSFEDYMNADMRISWAEGTLADLSNRTDPPGLAEDIIKLKRGTLWCKVAKGLEGRVKNKDWKVIASRILREEGITGVNDHPGAEVMSIIYNSKEKPPKEYVPKSEWAKMMCNHAEYLRNPSLKAMAFKEDLFMERIRQKDSNLLYLATVLIIIVYGVSLAIARRWVLGRR
ncbi:MAG: S16 family serine protease [Candidatus Asgardarchaeia archaeon]